MKIAIINSALAGSKQAILVGCAVLVVGGGVGAYVLMNQDEPTDAGANVVQQDGAKKTQREKESVPPTMFTVTFDANGAEVIGEATQKCETRSNSCVVVAPSISRNGYTIRGWAMSAGASEAAVKEGDEIVLFENVTYYAVTDKVVTATFNANGAKIGASTLDCTIQNMASSCTVNTPSISRSGYVVKGWAMSWEPMAWVGSVVGLPFLSMRLPLAWWGKKSWARTVMRRG